MRPKTLRNDLAGFDGGFKIGVLAARQRRVDVGGSDDVFAQVMQIACGDRMGCDPALQAVAPADAVAGERQIIPEIIMQMREKCATPTSGKKPMPVSGMANMVFSVTMRCEP